MCLFVLLSQFVVNLVAQDSDEKVGSCNLRTVAADKGLN